MFSDGQGDNIKKCFLETFAGKKPQSISLLLWLLDTSSVCGRRAKSSFAHASLSHPQPTPTAERVPIFRLGVTCPQLARLC